MALDDGDRLASLARLEANPEENARAVAEATANLEIAVESEEAEAAEEDVTDEVEDTEDVTTELVE
jgi:hypothetical protein